MRQKSTVQVVLDISVEHDVGTEPLDLDLEYGICEGGDSHGNPRILNYNVNDAKVVESRPLTFHKAA